MTILNEGNLASFFSTFRILTTTTELNVSDLKIFFGHWEPIYQEIKSEWARTADRFNIFEALDVQRAELRHSAFLAYLLDPLARHDQDIRFLRSFLKLMCKLDAPDTRLRRARISREWDIGDGGRLDIVIQIPGDPIVVVENKIGASEQDAQISRYQKWIKKQQQIKKDGNSCILFLTPDGCRPRTEDSTSRVPVICQSYSDLIVWLNSMDGLPPKIEIIRNMYVMTCKMIGDSQNA